jgi:hypothetical protein
VRKIRALWWLGNVVHELDSEVIVVKNVVHEFVTLLLLHEWQYWLSIWWWWLIAAAADVDLDSSVDKVVQSVFKSQQQPWTSMAVRQCDWTWWNNEASLLQKVVWVWVDQCSLAIFSKVDFWKTCEDLIDVCFVILHKSLERLLKFPVADKSSTISWLLLGLTIQSYSSLVVCHLSYSKPLLLHSSIFSIFSIFDNFTQSSGVFQRFPRFSLRLSSKAWGALDIEFHKWPRSYQERRISAHSIKSTAKKKRCGLFMKEKQRTTLKWFILF